MPPLSQTIIGYEHYVAFLVGSIALFYHLKRKVSNPQHLIVNITQVLQNRRPGRILHYHMENAAKIHPATSFEVSRAEERSDELSQRSVLRGYLFAPHFRYLHH